jgi:hypothetical protein
MRGIFSRCITDPASWHVGIVMRCGIGATWLAQKRIALAWQGSV